mmetsp:Transcript_665/g.799  ORF Transcript_665/g.799 Transcript_665/m.799 type:complete len:149 (-) Transcript_665:1452-1898(-)
MSGDGTVTMMDEDMQEVEVLKVQFHNKTNVCGVAEALDFSVQYRTQKPVRGAKWEINYLLDVILKDKNLYLGTVDKQDAELESSFRFQIPSIDVSGIKTSQLCNVGLLTCTLKDETERELHTIKMVVQVSKEDGEIKRCLYSPEIETK